MKYSIKTCPSCGSVGRLRQKNRTVIDGETVRNCYVFCPNCDFRGPRILYSDFDSPNDAVAAAITKWNRRV